VAPPSILSFPVELSKVRSLVPVNKNDSVLLQAVNNSARFEKIDVIVFDTASAKKTFKEIFIF
jgi:hypothetical protein